MKKGKDGFYYRYIKRIIDIMCVVVFFILFFWLYVVIAILIRINLGSPVLFKQPRPGKNGEIFNIYKFRSMTNECDKNGELLSNQKRLTRFGKMLRSLSLDELPELYNILIGELSFVGPRPLKVEYLPLYNERQMHRHDVTPGLTGLAQVNGRNGISWEKKFEYDLQYIDNISFINDIVIIIKTIATVFKREGISAANSVTIDPFMGTSSEKENIQHISK